MSSRNADLPPLPPSMHTLSGATTPASVPPPGDPTRGSLTALMGPSGAGKTSLLDVLAGRRGGMLVGGELLVNGAPATPSLLRGTVGYVTQEDVLPASSTVFEVRCHVAESRCLSIGSGHGSLVASGTGQLRSDVHAQPASLLLRSTSSSTSTPRPPPPPQHLLFHANLRMHPHPGETPADTRNRRTARVRSVLSSLGLSRVAHSLIGGAFVRGLSKGEQRRVSIAVELLSAVDILLLDEPTTGLDSTNAAHVVSILSDGESECLGKTWGNVG